MLFDTHAHYTDERFADDRDSIIEKAHSEGVSYILNPGTDMDDCRQSILLSQKYDFVYSAIGIHPHNAHVITDNTMEILFDYAKSQKVVAIGEIGLDYYYDNSPREAQRIGFEKQIGLALDLKLPIIVHDRDAHEDTLKIIKESCAKSVGGVFHCFSGSIEMAKDLLNNNFYISIGGPVTFKNAKKLIDVVKFVPKDRLLIETDCPYLTPEPFRGKRNDSSFMYLVVEKISEISGRTFEEVADETTKNAKKLFKII